MLDVFQGKKAVLFDLDGTVYYGDRIIPGALEAIERCRAAGLRTLFLTNNSTKTRDAIRDRLAGMGVECGKEEVLTSGYAAVLHAKEHAVDNLYICGSSDLVREFAEEGMRAVDAERAENLLIGYDPHFDYEKLTEAVRVAVRARTLIACNKERVFRGKDAGLFPGCGGMTAPIEWCSGRSVDYVVGKPNARMVELACHALGCSPDDVVMVGDTYESDIVMANEAGCASILVGGAARDDTIVVGSIGDIAT